MDATIRATCPNCQSTLKIPAQWAGQPVKCKKCGAVVRTKGASHPAAGGPAAQPGTGGHEPLAPTGGAFTDLTTPAAAPVYNPFEADGPAYPPPYDPNAYHPAAPHSGYPAPPGYPYPVPPGYPYPLPPGYGPPPGYGAPTGYAPPPGYEAAPPGYPYPAPAPAGPYPQPAPTAPAPHPHYAAHQYPAPAPVPPSSEFKPSETTRAFRGQVGKYHKSGGKSKILWVGMALFLTVGLVASALVFAKGIKPKAVAEGTGKGHDNKGNPASGNGLNASSDRTTPSAPGGIFPRRLLFIHVSNYLYLNPLTSQGMTAFAKGGDLTKGAASRLAYEWRVPNDATNNQIYLLSDTAPGQDGRSPMKPVITGAYEKFFETSRDQDRIVVYFGGHVLARKVDDKDVAFLVPMDGDPDETDTLIPLADFYAKLEACKATQKVVIWDVCRFNPERGRKRPGSEPMTEEVAAALAAAPAGVQVITTCQPGENALEFYNLQPDGPGRGKFVVAGSNFLAATQYVAGKNPGVKSIGPNDPIPVEDWVKNLSKRVTDVAATNDKSKQTLKLIGSHPETLVAFKADEASPARFDLPTPPKGSLAGDIAGELTLPGLQADEDESAIGTFPFPADALAPFAADVPITEITKPENAEKYKFRVIVLDAFKAIHDVWSKKDGSLRDRLELGEGGRVTEAIKKDVAKEQEFPGLASAKLERAIALLEAVEPLRAAET